MSIIIRKIEWFRWNSRILMKILRIKIKVLLLLVSSISIIRQKP